MRLDKDEIRKAATGRWRDIHAALSGIPYDAMTGKNGPCPLCNQGKDCFSSMKGVEDHGRVLCRKCLPRPSDGFAVVMAAKGCDFYTALKLVAGFLNIAPSETNGHRSYTTGKHATNGQHDDRLNGHRAEAKPDAIPVAGVQVRDRAYSAILDALELADDHRQALLSRGLTDEAINKAAYRTLPAANDPDRLAARDAAMDAAGEEWQTVPGIGALGKGFLGRSILVPCVDCQGLIIGMRLRLDDPGQGGRYRYLSDGRPTHPPTCHVSRLATPGAIVRLSEGELKSDVASTLSEVLTVSVPGVNSWRAAMPVIDELKPAKILLAFDADCRTNRAVARALIESYGELTSKGYLCSVERWEPDHKGIDDALTARAAIDVLEGAAADAYLAEIAQSAGVDIDKFSSQVEADPLAPVHPKAPWKELEQFEDNTLPSFPTECLPGVFGEYIASAAHATQVPPEMAAILALATGGAAIAKKVEVQGPGWVEPANIFTCGIMPPGSRKSQIFRLMTGTLMAIEAEEIANEAPAIAEEQSRRRMAMNKLRSLESSKKELTIEQSQEREKLAQQLATWREPLIPKLVGDNITSEDLQIQLDGQNGRYACMAPEGSAFDVMLGRYSDGKIDIGVYLNGHAGDDIRVGRVGRPSLHIKKPALTVAFTMQEDVLKALRENASVRGRGLMGRFLWAMPASMIGRRLVRPRQAPFEAAIGYENAIRFMYSLSPRKLGFGPEADRILLAWQEEVEAMCGEGGRMEAMSDWGAKLVGLTLRLSGILHCASCNDDGEILPETLKNAITISRWAICHAQAVLVGGEWVDGVNIGAAKRFLRWITKEKLQEFTRRELHQAVRGAVEFKEAASITAGLRVLAERGFIRRRQIPVSKGAQTELFDVNPLVFASKPKSNQAEQVEQGELPPTNGADDNALPDEVLARTGSTIDSDGEPWNDPDRDYGEWR